jgi:hypothetical protein
VVERSLWKHDKLYQRGRALRKNIEFFFAFSLVGGSSIPSVDLAARMRLIIYLKPWSESISLSSLIS